MILYDENYKFLGISQKELNRLGFDNITEFNTYYKDFAELFEKEDNLIYNFENFSWLDFMLYGGTNKDTAIIKDKSNQLHKVKIKISKIELVDEIFNVKLLYSVKLDYLEKIEKKAPLSENKIDLSNILSSDKEKKDDDIKLKKEQIDSNENDLDINLSFINSSDLKEDEKSSVNSINLSFLKDEEDKNKQDINQPQTSISKDNQNTQDKDEKDEEKNKKPKSDKEIVLDFFNSNIEIEEENISSTQNISQEKEEKNSPQIDLNLLKDEDTNEPKEDTQEKSKPQPSLNLNFLKVDEVKEDKDDDKDSSKNKEELPQINLNFLKSDENKQNDIVSEDSKPQDIQTNNLNFLKIDETNNKKEDNTPKQSSPQIDLNLLKDEDTNEPKEDTQEKSKPQPSLNLNFLKVDEVKEDKDDDKDSSKNKEELPQINLNFLKSDENKQNEIVSEDNKPQDIQTNNLNFLKIDETNNAKEDEKQPQINLNFLKSDENKAENKTQKPQEEPKSQNEKTTPSINLNFLKTDDEKDKNLEDDNQQEQNDNLNTLNFLNTQEEKEQIPSLNLDFLKTDDTDDDTDSDEKELKSTSKNIDAKVDKIVLDKVDIDINETQKDELSPEKKSMIINQIKNDIKEIDQNSQKETQNELTKKETIAFLPNIDIPLQEKKDILNDFKEDCKQSLNLVQKFISNGDIDSTKFILSKLNSSVEVLELNVILKDLKTLQEKISSLNLEEIKKEIEKILNIVQMLKV